MYTLPRTGAERWLLGTSGCVNQYRLDEQNLQSQLTECLAVDPRSLIKQYFFLQKMIWIESVYAEAHLMGS